MFRSVGGRHISSELHKALSADDLLQEALASAHGQWWQIHKLFCEAERLLKIYPRGRNTKWTISVADRYISLSLYRCIFTCSACTMFVLIPSYSNIYQDPFIADFGYECDPHWGLLCKRLSIKVVVSHMSFFYGSLSAADNGDCSCNFFMLPEGHFVTVPPALLWYGLDEQREEYIKINLLRNNVIFA